MDKAYEIDLLSQCDLDDYTLKEMYNKNPNKAEYFINNADKIYSFAEQQGIDYRTFSDIYDGNLR
ncbi:MAG: hypothetical protein RCG15_02175 [Candidatus Rickettsia vulgarisii]